MKDWNIDVVTAEYSKIRVTAFARSGSNTSVDVVVRMTDGPEGGYLGELDRFHIKSDDTTSTKLYEIPGPNLKFQLLLVKAGTATIVLSIFGDKSAL